MENIETRVICLRFNVFLTIHLEKHLHKSYKAAIPERYPVSFNQCAKKECYPAN